MNLPTIFHIHESLRPYREKSPQHFFSFFFIPCGCLLIFFSRNIQRDGFPLYIIFVFSFHQIFYILTTGFLPPCPPGPAIPAKISLNSIFAGTSQFWQQLPRLERIRRNLLAGRIHFFFFRGSFAAFCKSWFFPLFSSTCPLPVSVLFCLFSCSGYCGICIRPHH